MWVQIGGLVVALLGVAASANWLVRGSARRIAHIKAQAELLAVLPPNPLKDALEGRIIEELAEHLKFERSAPLRRLRIAAFVVFSLGAVSAAALLTGVAGAMFAQGTPSWTVVVSLIGFVGAAGFIPAIRYLDSRLERTLQRVMPSDTAN